MICDLESAITSGATDGAENLGQFEGFALEFGDARRGNVACAFGELDPEIGFVRFLQHDRNLVEEIGSGLASKRGAVIRGDRGAAAGHLAGHGTTRSCSGQSISKLKHPDGKIHRSLSEFLW